MENEELQSDTVRCLKQIKTLSVIYFLSEGFNPLAIKISRESQQVN